MSLGVGLLLAGCAGSGPAVVATIGKEPLTLEDFEASYAKNNGGWDKGVASTQAEREHFLDLLVKFRLKVMEATKRGLLADSSIQSEMDGYKIAVATSYMLEKEIVDPHIKELYARSADEIHASHILIKLDPNALPADTIEAYKRAMKIIALIPTTRFDTLAARFSEEPNAAVSKGDLGIFTTGRMVPEFEDACYQLKPGQYTLVPIRSQFGYHIIKVLERQPNRGAVHIAHIMWRFNGPDTLAVRDSIQMVYQLLKSGMDFGAAAKKYSQDPASSQKGGDLSFFDRGKIPQFIENVLFTTPVDSVAEPMQLSYGYHIFKILGYSGIQPFEQAEKDIRQHYQQTRYNLDYEIYIRNLKTRYRLYFDEVMVDRLAHSFDTTSTPSVPTWSDTLKSAFKTKVLFLCEDKPYTINDFVQHVDGSGEFKSLFLYPKNVRHMVDRMAEAKIVEENARLVPQRYPAFSNLLKEYQDGILLYRIEQDEIWKKIVVNDSLLKVFHSENADKYRWPERVSFSEVYVTTDSLMSLAYNEIKSGKNFNEVAERYTMRPGYKEKKGVWELTPVETNDASRRAFSTPVDSTSVPFQYATGWAIVKVIAKDSAHAKTFAEATPELLSAYQEQASKIREEQWLTELRNRYPIVVRKEALSEAFKRKPVANQ
jgi:peptidyl-prolyl cis-trans isomerase SurA